MNLSEAFKGIKEGSTLPQSSPAVTVKRKKKNKKRYPMQHCSRFQCCCLSWILIVIAHLITEALSCIGISHPSWEKEMVPGRKMRLNVARLFFFYFKVILWRNCSVSVFFKLKRAQRAHMHLFRLYRMQRVCVCVCVCVCVSVCGLLRQNKLRPSVRPCRPFWPQRRRNPLSFISTHRRKTHCLKRSKRQSLKKM